MCRASRRSGPNGSPIAVETQNRTDHRPTLSTKKEHKGLDIFHPVKPSDKKRKGKLSLRKEKKKDAPKPVHSRSTP
jgi:hypothetical protein